MVNGILTAAGAIGLLLIFIAITFFCYCFYLIAKESESELTKRFYEERGRLPINEKELNSYAEQIGFN